MGKTIYVVTDGDYSDYHICGAFSTRKTAEAYKTLRKAANVEEWELDGKARQEKVPLLTCTMYLESGETLREDARLVLCDPMDRAPYRMCHTPNCDENWAVSCGNTVSAALAKKQCVEARQEWLRTGKKKSRNTRPIPEWDNTDYTTEES